MDDLWRYLNALLALIAAVLIAKNLLAKWRVRKPRMRLMSMAMLAMLLATFEGSLENVIQGYPPGPRTVLVTAAVIWVLVAVVLTPDDYTERDAGDGTMESWPSSQSSTTSTAPRDSTDLPPL